VSVRGDDGVALTDVPVSLLADGDPAPRVDWTEAQARGATGKDGKALVVVQGKRKVLALIWGGKLDVEPRGIVG
jgi:hypothetical protein